MKKSIWVKLLASFVKLVFPAILLVLAALVGFAVWLSHKASEPPKAAYLVTPESLSEFTRSKVKISDENWQNKDATTARGWLLHGKENAPAVVLLHRFGADRSWLLNLGVRLNEETGFTILIPDQRGHGANPAVKWSSFGGAEGDDLAAAAEFLRSQKTANKIGVYGIEMGAIATVFGLEKENAIQAVALDSVPASSNEVVGTAVKANSSVAGGFAYQFVSSGTYLYSPKAFRHDSTCDAAGQIGNRKVLLLAGQDAPELQKSTAAFAACLPNKSNVQSKTDLPVSGYNLINSATSRQQDEYNETVINFFRSALN